MDAIRTKFQGISNIIRFNWHFYLLAIALVAILFLANYFTTGLILVLSYIIIIITVCTTLTSIIVSLYIYDLSGLYKLDWFNNLRIASDSNLVNIHAGFDEISLLLNSKYPYASLVVYDFYDPIKHTEISIKRARKAYLPYTGTLTITTSKIPLSANYADCIFLIFSAHEIRNENERIHFFFELNRVLKIDGQIILLEHLRDWPNFLAYNAGFFHFLSKLSWYNTFDNAKLIVANETKLTPLISKFILKKNGE